MKDYLVRFSELFEFIGKRFVIQNDHLWIVYNKMLQPFGPACENYSISDDNAKKILRWDFEKLEKGERRVITYIIYSKVGVLGKFALPSTIALYERNGKIKEVTSNKVFFVAEAFK